MNELIKSISGIRGTIGGKVGTALTPIDIVKFTAAYAKLIINNNPKAKTIIIGRDGRVSGLMVSNLVSSTLISMGLNVVDLGLSTTPTVEYAVTNENADGGIIITASHNPANWNALKFLNGKGEFISNDLGVQLLEFADNDDYEFSEYKTLGALSLRTDYIDLHIKHILTLTGVDAQLVENADFKVVVDGINSSGSIAVPMLLKALGVKEENILVLNAEPNGHFAHNPEPLPKNINEICNVLKNGDYNLGIIVDPDVDRLAFVCEDGEPFGEEYTLVAIADYILSLNKKGKKLATVSNLSSTQALKDITENVHAGEYHASAVGEVNVVTKMKEVGAIIGGEGNGGIIYPESHYGRDALIGIALFLSQLAKFEKPIGFLRKKYPNYHIEKQKIDVDKSQDLNAVLEKIVEKYSKYKIDTTDGVKIHFEKEWVHLRKSNTEPIIRIYAESELETTAKNLANKIMQDIKEINS